MINIKMLSDKLKKLVPDNVEQFKAELKQIESDIKYESIGNMPILIYSKNRRNAICYTLSYYLSIKKDKLVDYVIVSGQNLINQHFMSEENKDLELYNAMYYNDVCFVYLSQYDYVNEYLENLIMSLVDFRTQQNKITIIIYDIQQEPKVNMATMAKKISGYFTSNGYAILDITKQVVQKPNSINDNVFKARRKEPIL